MASPAEMIGKNMISLQSFPANMGKQRISFTSARNPSLRRSRMVRHSLDLRHLCWFPNRSVTVPNIRSVPAQSATVSSGVNSQLIEESVNDLELVSRIIHFYRKPFLQESETKELLRKVQAKVSSDIIAFVGGFSYADVLDSAKGWAASIRFNQPLIQQFQDLYNRPDTFSLGVCNGCQLMALLGWVPGPDIGGSLGAGGDMSQPRFTHNESGRFECRFISVTIGDSPSIMLKGMEGSSLGIWSAHGEGKAFFPDEKVLSDVVNSNLAPLRYCDDANNATEVYPFNPNGSPLGIAALCSPNGRHLALMPHPERSFMMWQYPWYPKEWQVEKGGPSPWLRMFQNAREWFS